MQKNLPILYSFRRCPYAMRARMAIKLAKIEVELRDILLKDKPEQMLKASAKGTVPVLILENQVIDESLDIMLWALKQQDLLNLLDKANDSLELIKINDTSFKMALDRYKYPTRYQDELETNWQAEGEKFLTMLENNLEKNKFLLTDRPTLADYAIFPFIRQFRMPDKDWFDNNPKYKKLNLWLNTMLEDETFKYIMKKRPIWHKDNNIEIL